MWGDLGMGGAQLSYTWITASSYATLPSAPPTNTIGLITTIPVGSVIPTNEDLTGLSEGDVLLRHGTPSTTRLNILSSGRADIYPTGAHQMQSGVLVQIEAYLFTGIAWELIHAMYYDLGTINPAMGTPAVYAFAGGPTLLTYSTYLMYNSTASTGKGWVNFPNKINVTGLKVLRFEVWPSTETMSVGIAPNYSSVTDAVSAAVTPKSGYVNVDLDVSAASGDHHIVFGRWSAAAVCNIKVRKIWAN